MNVAMKTFVIISELVIVNLLYWAFCQLGLSDTDTPLRVHVLISALYFGAAEACGVVLHYKKVYRYQVMVRVVKTMLLFAIISVPALYICGYLPTGWRPYVLFLLAMTALSNLYRLLLRRILKAYRSSEKHIHNVVLMGSGGNMTEIAHELGDDPSLGYHIAGYFNDGEPTRLEKKIVRLGAPRDVMRYLLDHPEIDEIYCGLPSARKDEILPVIHYCENNLVHFYSVPNVRNYLLNKMHFNMIGNVPFLSLHEEPLSGSANRWLKRAFDILFSLAFLCTLFPLIFIVVAIITETTMPGPIFFRQKRTGLKGKDFYCLKFRSMKVNSDADSVQATKDDPRTTKWGHIMRKTNIDELPQFINVLLGDMSVVGPRPHMLKHTEMYSSVIDRYMFRHWVKPGITGWSQISGFRGETKELSQMEGRIRGDIWYVENWTFGLDLYIIYKTIAETFRGDKNAY